MTLESFYSSDFTKDQPLTKDQPRRDMPVFQLDAQLERELEEQIPITKARLEVTSQQILAKLDELPVVKKAQEQTKTRFD